VRFKRTLVIVVMVVFALLQTIACVTTDGSNACPLGTHWYCHTNKLTGIEICTCVAD